MKRKTLTILTIGSILCLALSGCGASSGEKGSEETVLLNGEEANDRTTEEVENEKSGSSEADASASEESGQETEQETDETEEEIVDDRDPAGLYLPDGRFIPWEELGIDVGQSYLNPSKKALEKRAFNVFRDHNYDSGKLIIPLEEDDIGFGALRGLGNSFSEPSYQYVSEISFPKTLREIDDEGLASNDYLTTLDFGHTQLTRIGKSAFQRCGDLVSISLPDTLESIGEEAFRFCESLTSIDLSNTKLTKIEKNTFDDCFALADVKLPDTLESIGESAFSGCPITDISSLPAGLKSIGPHAFGGTSITSIAKDTFPVGVDTINSSAFGSCPLLTSVDLPDTVTRIESDAFRASSALTTINIPATITKVAGAAFRGCDSLTNINYAGTMEQWNNVDKTVSDDFLGSSDDWTFYSKSGIKTVTCSDGVITL